MPERLAELAAAVGIPPKADWYRVLVTDVCEDSRRVRPGALFVAIPGTVDDGAEYIDDAISAGAVAVATEADRAISVPCLRVKDARAALAGFSAAFYGQPTEALFTVGVTGTNGKTTVCHWAAHVLGDDRTAVIGTVANQGRGLLGVTTPPSPLVQRIAAESRAAGAESLIVEASSIGLEQRRLDEVDFDVGVFTNLTHDHLDLHGTMDAYLLAKRTLFRGLKDGAAAVVNAEDPASDEILDGCRARPWRYGEVPGADVRAIDADFRPRGTRLGLAWRGERAPLALPHPARHNVMNALAAACVGLTRGLSLQAVAARLADAPAVPGRLQFFSRMDGVLAVVDFAHSPDALRRALEAVRPAAGRLAVVFGCPGGSDRTKRPIMGEIAGRLADWTMLTSDNPKHEDPEAILDEISVGLRGAGATWERIADRGEAVRRAVRWARPGDVVLLAGKGHESFQIVGDAFLPYSDSCVLEASGFSEALPPVA